jgi:hypothetical protein
MVVVELEKEPVSRNLEHAEVVLAVRVVISAECANISVPLRRFWGCVSHGNVIKLEQLSRGVMPMAPVLALRNISLGERPTISASSLIVPAIDQSPVTSYAFKDAGNGDGHFQPGSTVEPQQGVYVGAGNLNYPQYVGSSIAGQKTTYVDGSDLMRSGSSLPLIAETTAPSLTVIGHNEPVVENDSVAAKSLFCQSQLQNEIR